jgi:DNA-binding response OmpR family regulator
VNPVVIVETEDVVRDAVADVLRDAGIEVVALADGWDIFLLSVETVPSSLLITTINLGVRLDSVKLAAAAPLARVAGDMHQQSPGQIPAAPL